MSTQEVAEKLVQLCREGKNDVAINELYADDIISLEQPGTPVERAEGKQAVIAKSEHWNNSVQEIHGGTISDPIVMADFFTISIDMDVTFKEYGRMQIQEIAVYKVKDGKIVFEQFFYSMPG